MKFATSAAVAAAATGAVADSSWSSWASSSETSKSVSPTSKGCGAPTTTTTVTTTAYEKTSEVYEKTMTVPIPDKPNSYSVIGGWTDWEEATCDSKKTVTSTSVVTKTATGTVTITKSVLFVGAKVTDSPDAEWNNWNGPDSSSDSSSDSGKDSGSYSGSYSGNSDSGKGSGSDSGSGWSSGDSGKGSNSNSDSNGWGNSGSSDSGDVWDGIGDAVDSALDGLNGNDIWGPGSWGGKGTGGLVLGKDNDVFHWEPPVPSNTASGVAPIYTQKPDGSYGGTPWGGVGGWGDWEGDDSDGSGDGKSGDGKGGDGKGGDGKGGKGNSTSPSGPKDNSTAPGKLPDFGSAASNLTKPFEPLTKGNNCNSGSDRSKWCGGLDLDTDYYKNYFGDCSNAGYKGFQTYGGGPSQGSCNYDLTLTRGKWNADGTDRDMILVNGQFPGPAIECNWGDLVTINVHNNIDNNGTAIHWHGVRQVCTNDQDGVPGVTECALAPGKSRTYTWRATSYGTSWYHSHWNLQYGDGVMGPIIIHGPATANYDVDAGPVMLTDTYPGGMSASAFGSLIAHKGPLPVDNYLLNGKNTKTDLSAGQHSLWEVEKGKKYLFRFINSAAQNMYSVSIDQHKMQVIAADFVPIVPYTTDWLNIGIGQRYDVVVSMDQSVGTYFLRAVTQTLCPSASANSGLGQANGIIAYKGCDYSLPVSTLNGNKTAQDFAICIDEPINKLVPHLKMDAGKSSDFQASASTLPGGTVGIVPTSDDGAVFRWSLNGGAMYVNYTQPTLQSINDGVDINATSAFTNSTIYANQITLKEKDKWMYFVIQNQFFAFHPMHMHGHDFSVLGQGQGLFTSDMVSQLTFDNPIRRDTAMLAGGPRGATSGGWTVIAFKTDNPGAWLMHCHIAWHVDGGLALQWLERPDDMKDAALASKSSFKDECKAYAAYEKEDPSHSKLSGQSGLKKREPLFFDRLVADVSGHYNPVVRRDEHSARHFLDSHMKRGLGDGANRRSYGRRR